MPFSFELNAHTLPALIVGGFLMLVAVAMSLRQWWSHRELQRRVKVDEHDYAHLERQIQRRLVMSGLFFLVGFLISIGNRLDGFIQQTPNAYFTFSFTFLGGVLLLVAAIIVLGLVDLLSTVAFTRRVSGQLRGERQKIEEELRQYRARLKSGTEDEAPTA
ncbi:MAG: hypothetical protein AABP62_19405 [Planctomycetota bacterium]